MDVILCIINEHDLYDKYTLFDDENTLDGNRQINSGIIDYLQDKAQYVSAKTKLKITIQTRLPVSIDHIDDLIKAAIKQKLLRLKIKLKKINLHSILLALTGLVSVSFTHMVFKSTFALHELFIVIGWVFIWRAIEIIFFDRLELASIKAGLLKIHNAEYVLSGEKKFK